MKQKRPTRTAGKQPSPRHAGEQDRFPRAPPRLSFTTRERQLPILRIRPREIAEERADTQMVFAQLELQISRQTGVIEFVRADDDGEKMRLGERARFARGPDELAFVDDGAFGGKLRDGGLDDGTPLAREQPNDTRGHGDGGDELRDEQPAKRGASERSAAAETERLPCAECGRVTRRLGVCGVFCGVGFHVLIQQDGVRAINGLTLRVVRTSRPQAMRHAFSGTDSGCACGGTTTTGNG